MALEDNDAREVLNELRPALARIEAMLGHQGNRIGGVSERLSVLEATAAKAEDVRELSGRVQELSGRTPTIWQVIVALVTIGSAAAAGGFALGRMLT